MAARGTPAPAPGRVPEAYVRAEIASFPLASEVAFRHGMTRLDPTLADGGATQALWHACEARLSEHISWSIDRLVAMRDSAWFGTEDARRGRRAETVTLSAYLKSLARSHLAAAPGVTRMAGDFECSSLDAGNRHRWLCFSLPEDLLLGALGVHPAPDRTEPGTPLLLRRLLDAGVAEIHQHFNAGMDFPLLWASALAALATPHVKENALEGQGVAFSDGKHLVRWMLAAAVARCMLGEYLIARARGCDVASVEEFIDRISRESRASGPERPWTTLNRVALHSGRVLRYALHALVVGDENLLPSFLELRDLYIELHPAVHTLDARPLNSVDDAFSRCDPLAARLGLSGHNAGERWLQRVALAHLEDSGQKSDDRVFEVLWWQLVRVRCLFYRAIVERPLTSGLQWFIRFYDRIGKLRAPLEPILIEASFKVAGNYGGVIAALEIRTRTESSPFRAAEYLSGLTRSWMDVIAEAGEQPRAPELGVVLHFIKTRDLPPPPGRWARGVPQAYGSGTSAEPVMEGAVRVRSSDHPNGRFLSFFDSQVSCARALAELIEAVPSVLWLLRGLDIASDELGAPAWVFVPIFEHVRQISEIASRKRDAGPPLQVTAHVGEDFRHLLEGMRRIYEHVHYVLGPRGGRLGHAIALGIDPGAWAASAGVVTMPAEERLWDLVTEWRLYTRYRVHSDFAAEPLPGRVEHIHNSVADLSKAVFGRAVRVQTLAEVHHELHCFMLPAPGAPSFALEGGLNVFERALVHRARTTAPQVPRRVLALLERYLMDEATFRRGQTPVEVVCDALDVAALSAVQAALRRGVAHRGIVIEVNPSSNLLIADLSDLRNHPILRLNPPERSADDMPPVPIAVGSDDPVTFSTSLLHEYVLLHQAARAAGYPERTVQAWLDTIRQTGMDARMTVAWRPTVEERGARILDELACFVSAPLHEPASDVPGG